MEAVAKAPTCHRLNLNKILRVSGARKASTLVLVGKDGFLSWMSENAPGSVSASDFVHMFHYQRGGILHADVTADRQAVAVDAEGCLQIFQPKTGKSEAPPLSAEQEAAVTALLSRASAQAAVRPAIAWSQKQQLDHVSRERQRYEKNIDEIGEALAAVRKQVGELLESNEQLPPEEKLDGREFELDSEEKQKRYQTGLERESEVRLDMKAREMARRKVGLRVRKEIWEDMEVKGKALKVRRIKSAAVFPRVFNTVFV